MDESVATLPTLPAIPNKQSIIQMNIRGLYPKSNQSKVRYLKDLATYHNSFAIALTETHLDEDIDVSEIYMNEWSL